MRIHAARSGALSLLVVTVLAAPPAVQAAPTEPPVTGGSGMRHGSFELAIARRDSFTAPPIDSLISMALAQSPDLDAIEARVAGARAAADATGGLMKLEVGLMYERTEIPFPIAADSDGSHDSHGGETISHTTMMMVGPDVELELPFPGGGRARREARDGQVRSYSAELESSRRQLRREIRTLWADIYEIDRELAAHRLVREMLTAIEESRRARVSSGGSASNALAASLAVVRLDEQCDDLEVTRASRDAALHTLIGNSSMAELPTLRALPELPMAPAPWESTMVAGSAELALLRARSRAADLEIKAAGAMLSPTLMIGGSWTQGDQESSNQSLRVGVTLPGLAGLDARPPVELARGEALALRAELAAAEVQVRSDAGRLERAWAWNEAQRRRYEASIRPLSLAVFEAARAALLDGRGELGEVLDSLMMWIDAEAGSARREAERFRLAATLEALTISMAPVPVGADSNGGSR